MRKFEDTYRHKGLRKQLMDVLREKGINNENVLAAMNNIPRHFFLDTALDNIAYEDRAFPIGDGQTISQPYTVAYQTQLLQVKTTDKVLEIGTGSIYQATVLAEIGAKVYTIEPFDKVIITAAAPFIPPKLIQQLKPGGLMVVPVDEGDCQRMLRLTKNADGSFSEETFENFSFVPMLTGKNR